ncbi:MAG TPA: arginine decarboxylase, pyruvoyl-dependent [Candidatus Hydrothermia bacterium]|nr:arginine decarboxylase, pyruvoyl-dependent [Candidatus Hydrothermae bacterium]MDD3648854.1 arginine decarboxylase, pyruvoyl-dependent [Candidatus Hydrothermia bacterium]MDD5572328.1 arginine decarboxylase, pyruvoyl-dependent [Candidatus Hydrothermia bacterium]HOK23095.1 arginine decarboxylase, pyruvoyl-dependent [Candidatus Hydrothermia bacterium]HOL23799.1 arginine decarboxylase, pyruvoyl-dependent [Candidatus Hydrothermia bacterium]
MEKLQYGKLEYFSIVGGIGEGSTFLNAFDAALIAAKVGNYNLVRVSSILPPNVKKADEVLLPPGSILPIAYGHAYSAEKGNRITAAVSIGIPENPESIGVIMEYSGDLDEGDAREFVINMAREAMEKRNIHIREILYNVVSTKVNDKKTCVFAAVALW